MSFKNLDINAPDHWDVNSLIHRHQERLRSIQLWIKCERSGLTGQRLRASKRRRNGSTEESDRPLWWRHGMDGNGVRPADNPLNAKQHAAADSLRSLLGDHLDLKLLEWARLLS